MISKEGMILAVIFEDGVLKTYDLKEKRWRGELNVLSKNEVENCQFEIVPVKNDEAFIFILSNYVLKIYNSELITQNIPINIEDEKYSAMKVSPKGNLLFFGETSGLHLFLKDETENSYKRQELRGNGSLWFDFQDENQILSISDTYYFILTTIANHGTQVDFFEKVPLKVQSQFKTKIKYLNYPNFLVLTDHETKQIIIMNKFEEENPFKSKLFQNFDHKAENFFTFRSNEEYQRDYLVKSFGKTLEILLISSATQNLEEKSLIENAALSNTLQYLIVSLEDKSLKILNTMTNKLIHHFPTNIEVYISALAVSNHSEYAAASTNDKEIRIWDFETKAFPFVIKYAHNDSFIVSMKISNKPETLCSAFSDGTIMFWSLATKQLLNQFSMSLDELRTMTLSFEFDLIASGHEDGSIKVFETKTKSEFVHFSNAHLNKIKALSISYDSKFIVSGASDKSIKVWDLESKKLFFELKSAHERTITSFSISLYSKHLLSGSEDRSVKLWNLETKKLVFVYRLTDQSMLATLPIEYSFLIVRPSGITISKIDRIPDSKPFNVQSPIFFKSVAASNDSRFIISGSSKGDIHIWNVENREICRHIERAYNTEILSVAISNDFKIFAAISSQNVNIWNLETLRIHFNHSVNINTDDKVSAAISNDSKFVVLTHSYHVIVIDIDKSNLKYLETAMNSVILSVAISGNSSFFIVGDSKDLIFYNFYDGGVIHKITNAHEKKVNCIAMSQDSEFFVTGSEDATFKLWNAETKELIHCMKSQYADGPVKAVAISDDCRMIISASSYNIKIWNLETNHLIGQIKKNDRDTICVAISKDSRFVFSSDGLAIKAWDIRQCFLISYDQCNLFYRYMIRNGNETTAVYANPQNGFTQVHMLAIFSPEILVQNFKKLMENYSWSSFVDKHGLTLVHYLICYQNDQYYPYIHDMLRIILEKIKTSESSLERKKLIASIMKLKLYIFTKINSNYDIQRILDFSHGITDSGIQNAILPDQFIGKINESSSSVLLSKNILGDDDIVKICNFKTNIKKKILIKQLFFPADFRVYSDSAFHFLQIFDQVTREFYFKSPAIQSYIDQLWSASKPFLIAQMMIYLTLVVTLTVDVSFGVFSQDNKDLRIVIIAFSSFILFYECIQILVEENKIQYFFNLWNLIDISSLTLILFTTVYRTYYIEDAEESDVLIRWLLTFAIFAGYLRLISYLRISDATRALIRTVLTVFEDMTSFLVIVFLIIIAFYASLMIFEYEGNSGIVNLYRAYFLLYSSIDGDLTSSEMVLSVIYPFILNVVFLNMLINIMGNSFEKVLDSKTFADYKEKVQMLSEVSQILRFFHRDHSKQEEKYLFYAEYEEEEDEEIEQRIISLQDNLKKAQESILLKLENVNLELLSIIIDELESK